jgi:hypothetical protein
MGRIASSVYSLAEKSARGFIESMSSFHVDGTAEGVAER